MIKIVDGDLLVDGPQLIVHQVNCRGKMGKGLAKQIKEKHPLVFEEYEELCKVCSEDPKQLLGEAMIIVDNNKFIANLFAQLNYGKGLQTDYDSLKISLSYIRDVMKQNEIKQIGIPFKLGCGNAGGDWDKVLNIIVDIFGPEEEIDVLIYRLKEK